MHVAIIMNGNGEWAARQGLPSISCQDAGAAALRTAVALACDARISTLTLYALCGPGSARPPHEIEADLAVLGCYLRTETDTWAARSIKVRIIADREWLLATLPDVVAHDAATAGAESGLMLRIVLDYSAHDRVTQAARGSTDEGALERFHQQLNEIDPTAVPANAVDLLICVGGGHCSSDFMLWEVTYAVPRHFNCPWPEFKPYHFHDALDHHAHLTK